MTTILQLDREDLRSEIRNLLRESIEEIRSLPVSEPLPDRITLFDACNITGLSKSQIYKMSMLDEIPVSHYGKRLVFSRSELLSWMEGRTISKNSVGKAMSDQLAKSAKKHLKK